MNVQETVATFHAEGNKGRAVVRMNADGPYIDYYDASGHLYFTEDFPGESVPEVEAKAEQWADGYKVLNG